LYPSELPQGHGFFFDANPVPGFIDPDPVRQIQMFARGRMGGQMPDR
jgi:hypothetical protein